MTTPQQPSPLTARLYNLEYPRSLGTYSTYAEVQAVVDALADAEFPVQNTMIVGTDLKVIERVTGRQTWGRVILNGVFSGAWMGLFIGLLLALFAGEFLATIVSGVLFGILFFTVWSVIGYLMSGGRRDYTSMTATIPMQFELMVEHTHAEAARQILASTHAVPQSAAKPEARPAAAPAPGAAGRPAYGQPAPEQSTEQPSSSSAAPSHTPSYGQPASSAQPLPRQDEHRL